MSFLPFNRTTFLVRSPIRPGQNESLLLANRSSLTHMGQGTDASNDPKGAILRQLRQRQHLDPAELATQACISLAQLYEIELGLTERFYSPSLREQAARRVAHLLNADWDQLDPSVLRVKSVSNVYHLQSAYSNTTVPVMTVNSRSESLHSEKSTDLFLQKNDLIPLGLSKLCVEDPETESPSSGKLEQNPLRESSSHSLWRVSIFFLLGILAGFSWAKWGPLDLILPWSFEWDLKLNLPWKISMPF